MIDSKYYLYNLRKFINEMQKENITISNDMILKIENAINRVISNISELVIYLDGSLNKTIKTRTNPFFIVLMNNINFLKDIYYLITNDKEYLLDFPKYIINIRNYEYRSYGYLFVARKVLKMYSLLVDFLRTKKCDENMCIQSIITNLTTYRGIINDDDLKELINEYFIYESDIDDLILESDKNFSLIYFDDLIDFLFLYVYLFKKDEIKDKIFSKIIGYIITNKDEIMEKYDFYCEICSNYNHCLEDKGFVANLFILIIEDIIENAKSNTKIKRL